MQNNDKKLTAKLKCDDAARAFRKYARLGLDHRELKVFEAYARIRGVSRDENEALTLLCVYDMMRLLSLTDRESADAVRAVYFFDKGRTPAKNQTSERILRFAAENSCDPRTVYRRLRAAKELFYHLRENNFTKV